MSVAVRVENLSKQYRLGSIGARTLREDVQRLYARLRGRPDPLTRVDERHSSGGDAMHVWALRDVSFDVPVGTILGIVGHNGAGKSTLLKILSRITAPTAGRVTLRGRTGSLLEVGTGFHPELTGRENVYLNGAILGMTKAEIARNFDAIVDFAGVERFIDTPVKRYSSGMTVRLGFAVAAHLDPEILVVDEVLAVGDAAFQRKCIGKMREVANSGRTILFVSHQLAAVQNLCSVALLLRGGEIVAHGPTADVLDTYLQGVRETAAVSVAERKDRTGTGRLRFTGVGMTDDRGNPIAYLQTGSAVVIQLHYRNISGQALPQVHVGVGIDNDIGQRITLISNRDAGQELFTVDVGSGRVDVQIPRLPLLPGRYRATLFAEVAGEIVDWVRDAFEFTVEAGDYYGTGKLPPRTQGDFVLDYHMSVLDSVSIA